MSADDFQIELPDYSSDDSYLGDDPLMGSASSQSASPISDESCPYCHSSFESLGCDYQEHVQDCAASCPLPPSPPSQSSISRLHQSVSKYQAQFHGLGLHRRLQMMEALHRLARRCTSDSPFSDFSPSSPERKASPTQDLDKKVFKMVWTRPSEVKDQDQKEKPKVTTPTTRTGSSSVPKKDGELPTPMKHGLKRKILAPISTSDVDPIPPAPPRKSVKVESIDPIAAFLAPDKEPQTPHPGLTTPPVLEESGFGTAILSPLDSPSGFDFSLSPPKESLGTAFFLTPSQSTPSCFPPKYTSAASSDVHWYRSQNPSFTTPGQTSTFSTLPNFSASLPPQHGHGHEPRSQEDVLKYLISQYQILLARTDAFLRSVDPKNPDMSRCGLPTPSGTESLLDATAMIQQLANLSSKKLQQSFSQVAKLQEQISQCQSNLFQAPNSLRKGPISTSSIAQSILGLATLAKAQEQLKSSFSSSFSRNWM